MILGPRDRVERWWEYVRSRHVAPRITRERQPIYVLKRRIARRTSEHLAHDVGPAGLDELNEIAAHAAAMIRHEIDVTIPPNSSHFLERTARIIRAGWYLRMRVNGELRFQCHIAARTRHTTQLQGVWTPSALRGRGYATQALAAVCDRLLNDTPTVSLYVNDFNADAIRLYERLGFTPAGEFMTIFF
jgi:predicted GNAT family acetyltransferase